VSFKKGRLKLLSGSHDTWDEGLMAVASSEVNARYSNVLSKEKHIKEGVKGTKKNRFKQLMEMLVERYYVNLQRRGYSHRDSYGVGQKAQERASFTGGGGESRRTLSQF